MARPLCIALAAALLALAPGLARAQGQSCEAPPATGPIALYILANAKKVHSFAATVRDGKVVRKGPKTVIFQDGRVVTADVEETSRHLNELGWAARPIQIAASFPKATQRPPASFG